MKETKQPREVRITEQDFISAVRKFNLWADSPAYETEKGIIGFGKLVDYAKEYGLQGVRV